MGDQKRRQYSDFSNVETMRNFLIPEGLPEGAYGSPRNKYEPVENKSSPWEEGQQHYSAFNYEFRSFHQDLPRQDPGSHPPHDDPSQNEQPPYES
ncbi:cytosolic protein [Aeribacillus alveayuensis]|uniref:Cytosolic protein n=1 Tax=Aeribacillus alveayuensis TaxID=279215 RepID=A0ABT9VM72_9BACI|nr:hypothetical protein [Bacillus alveayuensis]